MKSLKGVVLCTFSYEQTKEICVQYPSIFASPWYESWVWREKAMADFDISGEFFDLVANLYPSQRYLQIKSYHVLTPDMAVRVHSDGFVEGVYEAPAGYMLAKNSDNKEMKIFFANRLKPEQIKSLNKIGRVHMPLRTLDQKTIDRLNAPRSYKPQPGPRMVKSFLSGLKKGRKDAEFLHMVLDANRVDWLDQILHYYFNLPKGFSIEKDIPHTPFWSKEFPLYNLPPYLGFLLDIYPLYVRIVQGLDTRIVDLFRSIFKDKLSGFDQYPFCHFHVRQENPEEAFGIYKRFTRINRDTTTIEICLDRGDYRGCVTDNLGNITILQTMLPFLTRDEVENILELCKGYPLTEKILEAYLEEWA
nr:hypothetical protein Cbor_109 [Cedratvirus borely]